jgi:hypothetical protein
LDFLKGIAFRVFGDLFVFQHFLQSVVPVATAVTRGRAMIFGDDMKLFGE